MLIMQMCCGRMVNDETLKKTFAQLISWVNLQVKENPEVSLNLLEKNNYYAYDNHEHFLKSSWDDESESICMFPVLTPEGHEKLFRQNPLESS